MPDQTYETHVHQPRVWSIGWLLAVVAFVLLLWVAIRDVSLLTVSLVMLAAAVVIGVTVTRTFALRLQDRVIRVEMQTRLLRLGREGDLARVSLRQLIALRFASDAELPALIDRAQAERLTPDQIKRAIRDWQGDYLRT
jgi:predicted lysophospholipase L1 biosynthesis ABC-type transport system permease subunit